MVVVAAVQLLAVAAGLEEGGGNISTPTLLSCNGTAVAIPHVPEVPEVLAVAVAAATAAVAKGVSC